MSDLPPYSRRIQRLFVAYLRGYFKRHFSGVRVSKAGLPRVDGDGAFILYTNHPAWWDPILLMVVVDEFFKERAGYGPIDAAVLDRYSFLGRLGLFGVDPTTRRGLSDFLRTADAILAQPGTILGITAEGAFRDVRRRPIRLETGLAHLMRRHPDVPVVPLAIEYPFWNESTPEALVRFGEAFPPDSARTETGTRALNEQLEKRLEETMDALAIEAMERDPSAFQTIVTGKTGVGGIYDASRRLGAWFGGRRFDPSHAAAPRRPEQ